VFRFAGAGTGTETPSRRKRTMKKIYMVAALALAFAGGVAVAQVHDWHDLDNVHHHVPEGGDALRTAGEDAGATLLDGR
jgi:hypothetical protein